MSERFFKGHIYKSNEKEFYQTRKNDEPIEFSPQEKKAQDELLEAYKRMLNKITIKPNGKKLEVK